MKNCRLSSKLPRRDVVARRIATVGYTSLKETSHACLPDAKTFHQNLEIPLEPMIRVHVVETYTAEGGPRT